MVGCIIVQCSIAHYCLSPSLQGAAQSETRHGQDAAWCVKIALNDAVINRITPKVIRNAARAEELTVC